MRSYWRGGGVALGGVPLDSHELKSSLATIQAHAPSTVGGWRYWKNTWDVLLKLTDMIAGKLVIKPTPLVTRIFAFHPIGSMYGIFSLLIYHLKIN